MQENNTEDNTEVVEEDLSPDEDLELDILESFKEVEDKETEQPTEVKEEPESKEPSKSEEIKEAQQAPQSDVKAPNSWLVENKEWFNQQPENVKQEISRRVENIEKLTHQHLQNEAERRKAYTDIDEAVQPYEAEWNQRGISRAQAIRALAGANKRLETDPRGAILELIQNHGLTVSDLQEGSEYEQPQALQQGQMSPQVAQLLERQQQLEQHILSQQQADQAAKDRAELEEIMSLQNETDSNGRYLRPEMHNDEYLGKMRIVYNSLKATNQGMSTRDLAEMAYRAITGKVVNAPSKTQSPSIQRQNAERATLSVPGSSVPSVAPIVDVPDGVDDTVDQVMKEFGFV